MKTEIYNLDGSVTVIGNYTLDEAKEEKRNSIRSIFNKDANASIIVNEIEYHGGFDSIMKLDNDKRMSESLGATSTIFFDTKNVGHTLTIMEASDVVKQVAIAYKTALIIKQEKMVAIDKASTIEKVEII